MMVMMTLAVAMVMVTSLGGAAAGCCVFTVANASAPVGVRGGWAPGEKIVDVLNNAGGRIERRGSEISW